MTAVFNEAELCRELDRRHVAYQLLIVCGAAMMVTIAVPGERREIVFLEDGLMELERFVSPARASPTLQTCWHNCFPV